MTSTRAVSNENVHRRLDRHDKGPDVRQFQIGANRWVDKLQLPWLELELDAEVGPRTEHTANQIMFARGVYGAPITRSRTHHELSEFAQRLIRGTARRNPVMVALAMKRRPTVREWRQNNKDRTSVQEKNALHVLMALIDKHMSYVFGGGHVNPADDGPGDCSWLASREVQIFDPSIPTGTTFTLAEAGVEGMGVELTLMIKNIPGRADESHVIERWRMSRSLAQQLGIEKWVIEHFSDETVIVMSECGGSDNPSAGNGPSFFIPGEGMGLSVASRLAEFPIHRHVQGF